MTKKRKIGGLVKWMDEERKAKKKKKGKKRR